MRPPLPLALLGIGAVALIQGCAPTPRLAAPEPVHATAWSIDAASSVPQASGTFWEGFGSPDLVELIARARARNADLAVAAERVAAARAALRISRSALFSGSASAGLSVTRSDNVGGSRFQYSDGFGSLNAIYELDLFGRLRNGRRAALSRLRASEADRAALRLAVEGEVARSYVAMASLDARAALLERGLALARERQRILDVRVREGDDTPIGAGFSAVDLRQVEAQLTRVRAAQAAAKDALAVLTGEEAPTFKPATASFATLAARSTTPALPVAVLLRRPDVAAAEERIRAARADVGAARATFLPRLTLDAGALEQAASLAGPYGATLTVAGGLSVPLLDRARLKGELDIASASQRAAVASYRAALLNALREVEDALHARAQASARVHGLEDAVTRAQETARMANIQYLEGLADYRTLIDAQEGALSAQDDYLVAREELLGAEIDLFKATGGDGMTFPE